MSTALHKEDSEYSPIVIPDGAADELKLSGIDIGAWVHPATGPRAERDALVASHAGLRYYEPPPEMAEAMKSVSAMYPTVSTAWNGGVHDMLASGMLERVCSTIKGNSSPGVPWCALEKTNDALLSNPIYARRIGEIYRERVIRLSRIDPEELVRSLDADPMYAVREGLSDPVRVFIKNAPTKLKKALLKLGRVINSPSLPDQLVEKTVFVAQDDFEKGCWQFIPSKPGMGLTDVSCDALARFAESRHLTVGSDASVFDVSETELLIRADCEIRIANAINPSDDWIRLARNVTTLFVRRVNCTSDGRLYVRMVPGGMPSGRGSTASTNSRVRGLVHAVMAVRAGVPPAYMSMGDDCVECKTVDDLAQEVLNTFGIRLTDVEFSEDGFSFCSHAFRKRGGSWQAVPETPEKMMANFFASPSLESYISLQTNLRHHPRRDILLRVARKFYPVV
nr:RNA-dependent RNA polymerase [Sobelivirales sp.]